MLDNFYWSIFKFTTSSVFDINDFFINSPHPSLAVTFIFVYFNHDYKYLLL